MLELRELGQKITALLKKQATLRAENKRLERTLTRQTEELAALTAQLTEARQQLLAQEVAKAIPNAREKQKTRKQLDNVIGEIDKILTSLND